ncbi:hypothetical protein Pelo_18088 [Pelomyxa schiedti]|nr:hypothetical protein Pelo_18088 [Pelomyxa schiedti]
MTCQPHSLWFALIFLTATVYSCPLGFTAAHPGSPRFTAFHPSSPRFALLNLIHPEPTWFSSGFPQWLTHPSQFVVFHRLTLFRSISLHSVPTIQKETVYTDNQHQPDGIRQTNAVCSILLRLPSVLLRSASFYSIPLHFIWLRSAFGSTPLYSPRFRQLYSAPVNLWSITEEFAQHYEVVQPHSRAFDGRGRHSYKPQIAVTLREVILHLNRAINIKKAHVHCIICCALTRFW